MEEWQKKMIEAMKNLQDACNMNDEWAKCNECPFRAYCDSIELDYDITPTSDSFLDTI
jgi:acetyl-CoA carboxylase beta subunit